jgi:hypothetical protein
LGNLQERSSAAQTTAPRRLLREPEGTLPRCDSTPERQFVYGGENHGTRIAALADWNSTADHPDHLAPGRAALMHRREPDELPAPRQIVVRRSRGKWLIKSNGTDSEPYADRAAALRAAVADAYDCSKNGDLAQVIGQSEDGDFSVEWVYGRDPAPANA